MESEDSGHRGVGALPDYKTESAPSDAQLADNHRLDHLYTHAFKDGSGKYFTVVTSDPDGLPQVIDAAHPYPVRNKVKTRLTFIKSPEGGQIKNIELKRFRFYARRGDVETEEGITFSFPFFVSLIGFLQSFTGLNLNDITERRISLANGPDLDVETKRQFQTLASTQQGQELIREAVRNGQVTGSDIVNLGYRKSQLALFEKLMTDPGAVSDYRKEKGIRKAGDEAIWQYFFESNTWIFGYGLNFVFNEPLEGRRLEAAIRGNDLTGSGKKPDGVLKSSGIINSLCLVEIKTPGTALLESEAYRADCWQASGELSGGVAQVQKSVQKTLENVSLSPVFRPTDKEGTPTGEVIYSYRPKAYLLVGTLSEFMTPTGVNKEKFASFELLRRNISSPEIITFDELLQRARFIVHNSENPLEREESSAMVQAAEVQPWDETDIPF